MPKQVRNQQWQQGYYYFKYSIDTLERFGITTAHAYLSDIQDSEVSYERGIAYL